MAVIGIVGIPRSGKSVFLAHLYQCLRKNGASFFIQRACPDGEGQWSAEAPQEIVRKIRVKGKFDKEFIEFNKVAIQGLRRHFDIILVDLGGLPSEENRQLLQLCDYYILLARNDNDPKIQKLLRDWRNLLTELKLRPIAEFISAWNGEAKIISDTNVFRGVLARLDRNGVSPQTLHVISLFARFLISHAQEVRDMEEKFGVNIREEEEYLFIDVVIGGNGVITPEELSELLEEVKSETGDRYFGKGVIISGRLPVWVHSAIAHLFHASKFVAHFDPRFKGGVVVASHDPEYRVGQVISVEL